MRHAKSEIGCVIKLGEKAIENFYEWLIKEKQIRGVLVYKDSEILKTNLDEKTTGQFIDFAAEVFKKAEEALRKLPEMTGEVNYISIYLQNRVVVLIMKYGVYGVVVVARVDELKTGDIKEIVNKVRELLK